MENNNIDNTFNEASKTLEEPATFPGFDKVWAKVEEKLDKKEAEKRKTRGLWIPYGIAASLLIGSGMFYFMNKKGNNAFPQQNMAQHIASPKEQPAAMPEPVRKTDSLVKAKIQSEMLPPKADIAYHKLPERSVRHSAGLLSETSVPQPFLQEIAVVAPDDKLIMDKAERQNIEEVIAMGIRKEKTAMVQEILATTPSKKKIAEMNAVADTAEAAYPTSSFNRNEPLQEPEILAYNKAYFKKDKPVMGNQPGLANRIGNKEAVNSIQGKISGININSISGSPGSGKVNISISCQGSVQSNNSTLFIIDGKKTDSEVFKKIDPKKIVSIQVFKGEKATALFGNAAGGVILVETKDISKKEKRRLKKLLQEKLPQK